MHHQHHGHHRIRNAEQDHDDPMVVSVVYVTASKTFDGPIGGYKTLDGSGDANTALPDPEKDSPEPLTSEPAQATPAAHPALTQEPSSNKDTSVEQHTQATPSLETAKDESTTAEATAPAPTSSPSFSTKVTSKSSKTPEKDAFAAKSETAGAHQTQSAAYSFVEQPAASSTSSSSPSALAASNSQGMTAGAKAGLAIGIIAVIGALCLFALCLIRIKRKKSKKVDNEKVPNNVQDSVARAPSTRSTRTDATAPRLSLRPVTQFLPDLGPRGKNGNMVAAAGGPAQNTLNVPNENFSEKNEHQRQGDVANPFGQHAEVSDGIVLPIQTNKPTNPFGNHAVASVDPSGSAIPAPLRVRTPTPEATGINKTGAAALMGGPREDRYKAPNQLNVGGPPRPASPALSVAGTEFSMSSVSPGAPYTSNVHRIQLDFKPSMDDELGLKAGQLVRLLHEYDDGWALCIRLDRSQQGVAPRTCLSARPVKPRPAGNNRGPPPPGMFGPAPLRPSSPANRHGPSAPYRREQGAMSPPPRPVQRSMSPGPYGGGPQRVNNIPPLGGKRRSNSASQVRERLNNPRGPSPMNPNTSNTQRVPLHLQAMVAPGDYLPGMVRKPVPGQAI